VQDITNLSVSITTTGRPVFIGLMSDGTGSPSYIESQWSTGTTLNPDGSIRLIRGSTTIADNTFSSYVAVGATGEVRILIPSSSVWLIDVPAAGTYTYKAQATLTIGTTVNVYRTKLVAFEIA
jgi:hypothetical protein